MSKYYSFNDFMDGVIERANQISLARNSRSLEDLFDVNHLTYESTRKLVSYGWAVFVAVVVFLLSMGPVGIVLGITAFLATPVGAVVVVVLGGGAVVALRQMYRDRVLPMAVRDIGEKYKSRWHSEEGNVNAIDALSEQAAEELYRVAVRRMTENITRFLK